MNALPEKPITLLIAALGGEGGGVLADWIIAAAALQDYPVQSTSIPGVAQRTGATTYYVELFPAHLAGLGDRRPVMTLTPAPSYVDVMVSSELLETGRAMLRATNTGVTAIIDQRGTVIGRLPGFAEGVLTGAVQQFTGATPYVRLGNVPALATAALLVLWIVCLSFWRGIGRRVSARVESR